jgi:hypothetical protein
VNNLLPVSSLAGLGEALARAEAEGRAVTLVYAPTTIHHHTTNHLPVAATAPAPVVVTMPVRAGGGGRGTGHPGIDVDLTGYGEFTPPAYVAPLPAVQESRSWAPLVLLVSGWSGIGAVFATAVTDGSAFAIGCFALALVVSAGAFSVVYRDNH